MDLGRKDDWIVDVMTDLASFLAENSMPEGAIAVRSAINVILIESGITAHGPSILQARFGKVDALGCRVFTINSPLKKILLSNELPCGMPPDLPPGTSLAGM